MPEFVNPNSYTVHLLGPDGRQIPVKSNQKIILSEYFDRYITRGFIKRVSQIHRPNQTKIGNIPTETQAQVNLTSKEKRNLRPQAKAASIAREERKKKDIISKARKISNNSMKNRARKERVEKRGQKLVVGKKLTADATKLLNDNLDKNSFPISNNIGVGILSYNRMSSLKRLVDSIVKNTDLRKTTVFICDDGSTDESTKRYLQELGENTNLVVIKNTTNLGVAGNTNRLIRCLSRFEYGLILNDDVEVLQPNWEYLYVEAIKKSGIHHFTYREKGVYGAELGELINAGEFHIRKISARPHGAILAFTRDVLVKCGYFDESYGKYGMEHVDWSMKPAEFELQPEGFFDVEGSDEYFKLHDDKSAIDGGRGQLLNHARKVFAERRQRNRIGPAASSVLPEISYVIPFRNIEREDSIATVVANIRAQRYPIIHIVLVEQDFSTKINLDKFKPVYYYLAEEHKNLLFNKSKAFNFGVAQAPSEKVILHDADMLVVGDYTQKISDTLDTFESCHLGGTVIYTSEEAAAIINKTQTVEVDISCDRVIGYYEGGSLACTKTAYWRVGAFNEDYWGYGCEDCDFYARLAGGSRWREDRTFDLLHLYHGRVDGWNAHHKENKKLESELCRLGITQRIKLQISQLRRLGYGEFLCGN